MGGGFPPANKAFSPGHGKRGSAVLSMPPLFWVLGLLAAAGETKPGLGQTGREVSGDPDWSADWLCYPLLQMALSDHPLPDVLLPFWVKSKFESSSLRAEMLNQRPWLGGCGVSLVFKDEARSDASKQPSLLFAQGQLLQTQAPRLPKGMEGEVNCPVYQVLPDPHPASCRR